MFLSWKFQLNLLTLQAVRMIRRHFGRESERLLHNPQIKVGARKCHLKQRQLINSIWFTRVGLTSLHNKLPKAPQVSCLSSTVSEIYILLFARKLCVWNNTITLLLVKLCHQAYEWRRKLSLSSCHLFFFVFRWTQNLDGWKRQIKLSITFWTSSRLFFMREWNFVKAGRFGNGWFCNLSLLNAITREKSTKINTIKWLSVSVARSFIFNRKLRYLRLGIEP